jgi:hypothetical protein
MGSGGRCGTRHLIGDLSFWSCRVFLRLVTLRDKLVPHKYTRQLSALALKFQVRRAADRAAYGAYGTADGATYRTSY